MKKKRIFIGAAVIYCIVLVVMFLTQRELMYHPDTTLKSPQDYGVQAQIVKLHTQDGETLTAWSMSASAKMPTIVYLHGNAGNLGSRHEVFNAYHAAGFGVFALEWRGYGDSTGEPSEEGFYEDARTALRYLHQQGIRQEQVILYGESIGTGAAVQMATEIDAKGLVLEAPFTSLWQRAAEIYWYLPVKYLVLDRYDSLSKIKQVTEPLLIFHNTVDRVVPVHHGKALYEAANEPKKLNLVEHHGHVSFDRPWVAQQMQQFLLPEASR